MLAFPTGSVQYASQNSLIQTNFSMKTQQYNPSPLEQELARAIATLKTELSQQMSAEVVEIESLLEVDNPKLNVLLKDEDGDEHRLVVQIIQRIDEEGA